MVKMEENSGSEFLGTQSLTANKYDAEQGSTTHGARPSTALRHNYRCLKFTYIKDYSQAIARSTVEKNPEGLQLAKNGRQQNRQVTKVAKLATNLLVKDDAKMALLPRFRQIPVESPL
ncbi:hypothetical protein TNCV_5132751 [Trichonephila clavipes]|nr:hypothetical protein TNCV_5132751 [Trichonephila clavipes]